jgi:hypothetical protein
MDGGYATISDLKERIIGAPGACDRVLDDSV